jgi:hypothetical protein
MAESRLACCSSSSSSSSRTGSQEKGWPYTSLSQAFLVALVQAIHSWVTFAYCSSNSSNSSTESKAKGQTVTKPLPSLRSSAGTDRT